MTRFDEVKSIIAKRFAKQITDEIPVSSPQTVDALAGDLCEWMAHLYVLMVTDAELAEITGGSDDCNE